MDTAHLSLAQWELDATEEELRSFLANRREGIHRKALHSLYFAAFHAVRGLLATKGIEAGTHKGVHVAFALHLVKPGSVSSAAAKILSELQAIQERADYQVELAYDAADVARHLATARPLLEELIGLLGETRGLKAARLTATWREVSPERSAAKGQRRGARRKRLAPGSRR